MHTKLNRYNFVIQYCTVVCKCGCTNKLTMAFQIPMAEWCHPMRFAMNANSCVTGSTTCTLYQSSILQISLYGAGYDSSFDSIVREKSILTHGISIQCTQENKVPINIDSIILHTYVLLYEPRCTCTETHVLRIEIIDYKQPRIM